MSKPQVERRWLAYGPDVDGGTFIRLMAKAEGYVMVRRPGRAAFLLTLKAWNALPKEEPPPTTQGEDA